MHVIGPFFLLFGRVEKKANGPVMGWKEWGRMDEDIRNVGKDVEGSLII